MFGWKLDIRKLLTGFSGLCYVGIDGAQSVRTGVDVELDSGRVTIDECLSWSDIDHCRIRHRQLSAGSSVVLDGY